jgi:acetylglutamate kinase
MMKEAKDRARILVEALPYIREFAGSSMVLKYGGRAMEDEELKRGFAQDVVLLKAVGMHPVVVHGGGPQIEEMLDKLGISTKKVDGMRVTDEKTLEVVEMVLGGKINKDIVSRINLAGGQAIGLSGKDGAMLLAKPLKKGSRKLGAVGEVEKVNAEFLKPISKGKLIPVIAPLGVDRDGRTYNINADLAAGAVAAALEAEKLILLTDVEGVTDKKGKLISSLHVGRVKKLVSEGVVREGMIPKVNCCVGALKKGVAKTHIIDGRVLHAIILEIFTDAGIGTEIYY